MSLKKLLQKDERGMAVVEAAILLPLCMLMVFAVYYASIFMCQKANMQANLQNALVYYKNTDSDTYVTANANMAYKRESASVGASGSAYGVNQEHLSPYRFFLFSFNKEEFESFFRSMAGYMFFDTGDNIEITTDTTNIIVYKTIEAVATQTVRPAVSLAWIGFPDEIELKVTAKSVVTNGDELIRNIDLAVDLLRDTKLGEIASNIVTKVTEVYGKMKKSLGL